uniref:Uncharacterized protein n=1 Tax=Wuchereria bancrofti TaxID=6293 RepID=A0A1I8EV14_WUCBA
MLSNIIGQLIQNKTSAVLRTLNPEMFGPLVEFYITVTDQDGRPCQQRCLNSKGTYENCEERPIRLSSHEFIVFSDPIEFHEVLTIVFVWNDDSQSIHLSNTLPLSDKE